MKPEICSLFPVPNLLETESLLCIQPHPDDMEIGAGATIARLIEKGTRVSCLTVTDGSAGSYDLQTSPTELRKRRRKETEQSAALLGVKELLWLDFKDGGNLPYEETREKITRAIRQLKPQAVMVCDPWLPYEVHTDHIRTGLAAAEAAFLANMPNFYPAQLQEECKPHAVKMIAFYYTAYPNTFIGADSTWALKMKAISCHASQFPPLKLEELEVFLKAKGRAYNDHHQSEHGLVEAFKVLSPAHLHILEEAWRC